MKARKKGTGDGAVEPGSAGSTAEPRVRGASSKRYSVPVRKELLRELEQSGETMSWRASARSSGSELSRLDSAAADRHRRIELDHGRLTEWLVNDERGLEQGWTIASAPVGAEPLWIGIEIDDAGGVYPLTMDPVLTGPAWTAESNGP